MPIGIAEVGIPGLEAAALPAELPSSCRDDLVTVDDAPLWISITGSTTAALDRQALTVSLCGPDADGLTLGPGLHTLRSVVGQASGFDIDQLAFDSAPGGGPMPLAAATALTAPQVASAPSVRVDASTPTTIHLSVTGLGSGAGAAPANLILGESINAGWTATVVGGARLGPPVLIDGFANGWRMDPSSLGIAVHGGTVSVVLQWQPQKRVDVALVISTVAIVGCLVLAFLPLRRRSRRRRGRPSRTAGALDTGAGETAADRTHVAPGAATSDAQAPDEPVPPSCPVVIDAPSLAVPFRAEGPRAPVWVALLAGVLTGAVAGAIATPMAGVAAGVATVVVLLVPRLRVVLCLVAVACVVAAGGYTVLHQSYHHIPADGAWPLSFGKASKWAWGAVVFLGADGVVDVIVRRRRTGQVNRAG